LLTYAQSIILGLLQGVTELFPVSSLGHSVVLPALLGWHGVVRAQSSDESYFLAFLVGLHVATALALLVMFWRDWVRIVKGFFATLGKRRIETSDERLAWLLIVATIPVGLTGLAFEHLFRVIFAKPLAASVFLFVNGLILALGERYRRRAEISRLACEKEQAPVPQTETSRDGRAGAGSEEHQPEQRLATLNFREAFLIGVVQVFALFAGISRSGITIVAGLIRGLDHEDAAHFSFLLATPVILAAGLLKLPDLFGPLGNGVRGQILAGSICSGVAAYLSVRFLMRYFETRTLTPFAVYCLVVGAALIVRFSVA
jgi:undecaprenyl-diphosphatase